LIFNEIIFNINRRRKRKSNGLSYLTLKDDRKANCHDLEVDFLRKTLSHIKIELISNDYDLIEKNNNL